MKHSTMFIIAVVIAVFFGTTSALMQQDYNKQLQENGIASLPPVFEAIPQHYINQTSRHKLMIGAGDVEVYSELQGKNAIIDEID
jgi:hypothetical protein